MKFYADHRHKECKWNTISNSVTILPWKMSAGIHMWYVKLSPLGIFTVHSIFMWSVWKIHICLFIEKCVLSLTNFSGRHLFEAFHSHAQSSQFVDCLLPQDGKLVERMFIVPHTPINTLAQHQQLWCHQRPVLMDGHLKQCPNNPSTILYNRLTKTMHAYLP